MGIDLTIVPARRAIVDKWFLAYDRLSCERDYVFFDAIKELPSRELPENVTFDWYGDEGCVRETTDKYGDLLHYVKAGAFREIKIQDSHLHHKNRAILAFLSYLPPDTWVVLWWH